MAAFMVHEIASDVPTGGVIFTPGGRSRRSSKPLESAPEAGGLHGMVLKVLAVFIVIGVMIYSWHRNDLRRLTRDYACKAPFDGRLESCLIRFSLDEASTDTELGVNGEGLFMSSSSDALIRNKRWSFRYHVIRTPLFIPWHCLQVRDAKFPMRRYLRFDVPSNQATFFIPRETGARLLKSAGLPGPRCIRL